MADAFLELLDVSQRWNFELKLNGTPFAVTVYVNCTSDVDSVVRPETFREWNQHYAVTVDSVSIERGLVSTSAAQRCIHCYVHGNTLLDQDAVSCGVVRGNED